MIEKVINTIKKYNLLQTGDHVLIGISGGPDSVCLLHVLCSISKEFDLKISAVHINHMLRGEEAKRDEQYVMELCSKLAVPLYIRSINVKERSIQRSISIEEAGREVRYEQFGIIANETGATKIAVAHNRNDQAETLLMRIMRGTGLDGLKGIEHKRGDIIRPLLDIERSDIEEYCWKNELEPRIDSSNLESVFVRNKIRLELIPFINGKFAVDITDSLCRMSVLLREDNDYIEECAIFLYNQCVLKDCNGEIWLDIMKLRDKHAAVVKRVLRNAVKKVKGNIEGLESVHLEKVLELVTSTKTGKQLHLPHNIRIAVSYGILKVFSYTKSRKADYYEIPLNVPGTTFVYERGLGIDAELLSIADAESGIYKVKDDSDIQFFDYDKLNSGINIRNRRDGDVFKPVRSSGTKKLKKYFIEKKLPKEERDEVTLIAAGNEIVWIIGDKISDKFIVSDNTKSVLKLTCKKIDLGII